MKTFKQHQQEQITEALMSVGDIFKRKNSELFISQLISGGMLTKTGMPTLSAISPDSESINIIKNFDYSKEQIKNLQGAVKRDTGVSIGNIEKGANGFSNVGKEPSGAEWEKIICCAYNMISKNLSQEDAIKSAGITEWKEMYDGYIETGLEIVKNSFGSPSSLMEHFGAGTINLTKGWDSYFIKLTGKPATAATKTPKTDMYIGKQKISLKKYGGSQLMSGGISETLATLGFAYDNVPDATKSAALDAAFKNMVDSISEQYIKTDLPMGVTIGSIKTEIKKGSKSILSNTIKKALANQKEMTNNIRKLMESAEVKYAIVREAMTGENKFGGGAGTATHMMKFADNGRSEYVKISSGLVKHYAKATTFNISFKTSGEGGTAWTALKGIYSEDMDMSFDDELGNIITEALEETENEMQLNESIRDTINTAVNWGKDKIEKGVWKFIKKVLLNIWKRMKGWFMKGMEWVLALLGLKITANSPDVVW